MKRELIILQWIIEWDNMREIIKILPDLTDKFKSRKGYDEYYFYWDNKREFTLDEIEKLSEEFTIKIWWSELIIL